jgi:hypothetical protein
VARLLGRSTTVRAGLARSRLARLRAIDREVAGLEVRLASLTGTAPIPASSDQTQRHRLNRGGNRQLNRALHLMALVQARTYPPAQAYLARRRAEGKTWREAIRCLKRHLADVVYRTMLRNLREGMVSGVCVPPKHSAGRSMRTTRRSPLRFSRRARLDASLGSGSGRTTSG